MPFSFSQEVLHDVCCVTVLHTAPDRRIMMHPVSSSMTAVVAKDATLAQRKATEQYIVAIGLQPTDKFAMHTRHAVRGHKQEPSHEPSRHGTEDR